MHAFFFYTIWPNMSYLWTVGSHIRHHHKHFLKHKPFWNKNPTRPFIFFSIQNWNKISLENLVVLFVPRDKLLGLLCRLGVALSVQVLRTNTASCSSSRWQTGHPVQISYCHPWFFSSMTWDVFDYMVFQLDSEIHHTVSCWEFDSQPMAWF